MIELEYLNDKNRKKKEQIESIYSDMLKNIIDGNLFSGYKLTEQDLCEKYKVSRTIIRDVLHKLESNGIIEIIKNRGAFVIGFTKLSFMDMLEERRELEKLCVKYAIDRIQEEEYDMLEENIDFIQFYYNTRDIETLAKVFKGFHHIIYYSTYNHRLEEQMKFFYSSSNRRESLARFYEEYLDDLYIYYSSIFSCFKDKNKEKAQNLMEKIMNLYIAYQSTIRI